MNLYLYNYYWFAASITEKLFYLMVPVIFLAENIFMHYIAVMMIIGFSVIAITFLYKCNSCNQRALVHSGVIPKVLSLNRNWLLKWLIPDALVSQYFYCCKCGSKIQKNSSVKHT